MKIVTNSYTNATYTPRRSPNAPQATKPVPNVQSDAARPLSNRWTALDGFLPPVFTNIELKGRNL